jgi:flagellar basal-body rod protein FlgF
MDPISALAASGLRARMESLDMLANNIANASTGGYKADREFYSLYIAPDAAEGNGSATMPVIERPWTDLSQGVVHATGNPLDVALSGPGFFAVEGPSGPLYTRNGSFHISPGGVLVTSEGYPVRGAGGARLTLAPERPVEIAEDGSIQQDGALAGRLEVVDFPAAALAKQGDNYFRAAGGSAAPAASNASVEQGRLEASNTGSAESAVRLVSLMRQFEMLQKAVGLAGDMSRKAIEEVAKVGS